VFSKLLVVLEAPTAQFIQVSLQKIGDDKLKDDPQVVELVNLKDTL
jgi:hypothetical protein